MGCCGKKVKTKKDNMKIIQYSSAVKTSRVNPGSVARECTICKTRTIAAICPVCNIPIVLQKN